MGLLCSYSFGYIDGESELTEATLGLFVGLVEDPTKNIEYASEIVTAGQRRKIDVRRPFNIDAYEAGIRRNSELHKHGRRKKEVGFGPDVDLEDSEPGVLTESYVSNNLVDKMEDVYEKLLLDDELQYAVRTIQGLRSVFFVEEKCDILLVLRQALEGIPISIAKLKSICGNYADVAELIKELLGSGYSYEEMFGCC